MKLVRRTDLAVVAVLALMMQSPDTASGQTASTAPSSVSTPRPQAQPVADEVQEAEAFALGYQAYIAGAVYARSQILMEHDINPNAPLNAPLNTFNIYPALATPATSIDFTPNNDTVYGLAWLDLRHGPVLMTIPRARAST